MPSRRTVLAALGTVAVAGCTQSGEMGTAPATPSPTPTPEPTLPTGVTRVDSGFTIDASAIAATDVTVDASTVQYTEPTEITYGFNGIVDGTRLYEPTGDDRLHYGQAIPTDETPGVRLIPVYDGEQFTYRAYANAAFRAAAEWHLAVLRLPEFAPDGETGVVESRQVTFESVANTALGVVSARNEPLGVPPTEPAGVAVLNYEYDTQERQPDDAVGVALVPAARTSPTPDTPAVAFAFEFDGGGDGFGTGTNDRVTITHEGGDTVSGESLSVTVDGRAVAATTGVAYETQFPSSVQAGDAAVVTATEAGALESGAELRVVWSGERSKQVLAAAALPES
ncbi:hypothetical protein [Halosegnis longus]|uniref:Uncharacterized protein n=1 Tax=Halosegnis longus TaxID=2216012 RepID=A0AAJ4R8J6_9EURY|nr:MULTISPECIES: hypothetical protein [Halobacteriales]RNJ26269.1 hypothetical protein Nmn1133_05980 [Salella cibi]